MTRVTSAGAPPVGDTVPQSTGRGAAPDIRRGAGEATRRGAAARTRRGPAEGTLRTATQGTLRTATQGTLLAAAAAVVLAGCGATPAPRPTPQAPGFTVPSALPDGTGWGVHVLAVERAPNGATWVGTYGEGIFVWGPRAEQWRHIPQSDGGLSWGFVNSLAFHDSTTVWYGTVGNGFGLTTDGGATWRNWTFSELGPEWQYVAADGITVRGDTAYIATADGLRITGDRGSTWRCVQARAAVSGGSQQRDAGCRERINSLPSKYLLSLDVDEDGVIWVGHLGGLSVSRDGGRSWTTATGDGEGFAGANVRAVLVTEKAVWATTETRVYVDSTSAGTAFREAQIRVPGIQGLPGAPRALLAPPQVERLIAAPGRGVPLPAPILPPAIATSYGMVARLNQGDYRIYYLGGADRFRPAGDIWAIAWWGPPYRPLAGSASGLARFLAGDLPFTDLFLSEPAAQPSPPRHDVFARPIAAADGNTHIDGTYRYGSTMGGRFQQHQGVEFNNPAGTPVRAIGDGVVVYAGAAEQGANTVAIRHDRRLNDQYIYSTYYHNSSLEVNAGQRVGRGDIIARVGNTGRATNDHLHLEIHVAPDADSSRIVHPDVRFPPHTVNPQLWLEPLPGTGVVAGQVFNAAGERVPGVRVHGLVLPWPEETPFSFAETYADQANPDPSYGEHFAVGDVPAGDYTLGVTVEGRRLWRRVRVQPGLVTWVEFRP